jgi:hypothetical protein
VTGYAGYLIRKRLEMRTTAVAPSIKSDPRSKKARRAIPFTQAELRVLDQLGIQRPAKT